MDCIERMSSLETDEGISGYYYTLPGRKPITHVYLPQLMRETGSGCPQFEAHRA